MRPETTITLNKPSFRADEQITGISKTIQVNSRIC